jgi:hypothetical protein
MLAILIAFKLSPIVLMLLLCKIYLLKLEKELTKHITLQCIDEIFRNYKPVF